MNPRTANFAEMEYWATRDDAPIHQLVIGGPEEAPDVIPCPVLVGESNADHGQRVHVAFQLDEIEVAALAQGGTLWLTTWGGLPIHLVEVVQREATQRVGGGFDRMNNDTNRAKD